MEKTKNWLTEEEYKSQNKNWAKEKWYPDILTKEESDALRSQRRKDQADSKA